MHLTNVTIHTPRKKNTHPYVYSKLNFNDYHKSYIGQTARSLKI
jgi:hypothetical protein